MPDPIIPSSPILADPHQVDDGTSHSDLGGKAARGGAVVFASVAGGRVIGLGISAVLARLLSPEEFGLLGMVFTLTALLTVFSDMGLATATIQKATLSHAESSAAFWLNLLFAGILALIMVLAAPALAAFYEQPALTYLTLSCAIGFPIMALGTQHLALLVRRLAFGRMAVCELAGIASGGVVGIVMAWKDYGAYALIGQLLGAGAIQTALAWLASGWVPSAPRLTPEIRSMLRFGGYLTVFNVMNYFARNLDNVLVGRVWGASSLGLYTRAYSLMLYPIALVSGPVARVTIPTLSKLQDDLPRMCAAYVRVLKLIGFCTFPLMGFLVVAAPDVILIIFGDKWTDAIPIFRILCIAGFFQGIYNATGQIFIAAGRTDRMFRCGLLLSLFLVIAFIIGVQYGALGVAIGYAIIMTVALLPYLAYAYATIGLRMSVVVAALAAPLGASLFACGVAWSISYQWATSWPAALRLALIGGLVCVAYFGFLLVLCRPLLIDIFDRTFGRLIPRSGRLSMPIASR